MNALNNKIIPLQDADKTEEERVVLCHGHFNIIHPGHVRYLEYANLQGSRLVVSIQGDETFLEPERKHQFREIERASGVAAMQSVDQVVLLGEKLLKDAILKLKPNVLVLGNEFEHEQHDQVRDAIELLQAQGGTVLFHTGEFQYASTELLRESVLDIQLKRNSMFQQACKRQGFRIEGLEKLLSKFMEANLLVIGDTIVDKYVACDALGMSAEAPVIVARELGSIDYIGGASIVALHVKSLGASCHYISVVGSDPNALMVAEELDRSDVDHVLIEDASRPTTEKIRYMVEKQKMFRVSRMKEHSISRKLEEKLIVEIRRKTPEIQGILISDFVYGVITPRVLEVIKQQVAKYNLLVFGDLQCSSQVGNVAKFKNFNLLCPTEREARIALVSQGKGLEQLANDLMKYTRTKNLIMKLGAEGLIAYETGKEKLIRSQHFPALNPNPVDQVGAGDSLFATVAVGLCSRVSLMESSALGSCMAALAVQNVGNVPVSRQRLKSYLKELGLNSN